MDNRTVTQNRTYNHNKQTNKNTKLHRHWAQAATITPPVKFVICVYVIYITSTIIKLLNQETNNKYVRGMYLTM